MTEFNTSFKRAGALALLVSLSMSLMMPQGLAQTVIQQPQADPFEIKAAIPNHPRLVLKLGNQFTVYDQSGLMPKGSNYGCGLYKDDTRYLSQWDILIDQQPLTLLSANTLDGYAARFIYGNKAAQNDGTPKATQALDQTLVLERNIVVGECLRERLTLTNYGIVPVETTLKISFASDFADMFEVRGQSRKKRGKWQGVKAIKTDDNAAIAAISYQGLDQIERKSYIGFAGVKPDNLEASTATFKLKLAPRQNAVIECAVSATEGDGTTPPRLFGNQDLTYIGQKTKADSSYKQWREAGASFSTDNQQFNQLLERSFRDLFILRQKTPQGNCLAAGIPWFAVAFGRDQEITGLETLVALPDTTKEILQTLAKYQGQKTDSFTEESPGRIMHELRLGEMAHLKEIPFIPYYGTIDATPLFLCLLNRYVQNTGDLDLAKKLWPNVELALTYIDSELGSQKYLSYGKFKGALSNQGWKDSSDSVMYSNGLLAKPPIALCEVQGYLYQAWSKTAALAETLGKKELAAKLYSKAKLLKENFQRDYWLKDKNYLALALDGQDNQCDVVSSNPGHVLATGILSREQGQRVAQVLNSSAMQSGYGIRTLAQSEKSYNPISYHNGSIWPHDNALAVEGLVNTGYKMEAAKVSSNILDVAIKQPDMRLPELFCGFDKGDSQRPVWYPVSCSPQAWASGTPLFMLTNLLGLQINGAKNTIKIVKPVLPQGVNTVTIKGLKVGSGKIALSITPGAREPVKVLSQSKTVKVDLSALK